MRFRLADGSIVMGDHMIEVPIMVTIPAVVGTKQTMDGEAGELETFEIEPEKVEPQMFMKSVHSLSEDERLDRRVAIIEDDSRPDDRFYFVNEDPEHPGKWISTPKDLNMLKRMYVGQINSMAGGILAQSDWRVLRAVERDEQQDPKLKAFRADIRAYASQKQVAIEFCKTLEELIEEVGHYEWPEQK